MLTKIEVDKGWNRYAGPKDTGLPVDPGTYYRVDFKPDQDIRKKLSMVAVKDPYNRFAWLAPYERWVKDVLDGRLQVENRRSSDVDWTVVGIDPTQLRPWQREFVEFCWFRLQHNQPFRQVGHVSLGGGKTLAGLCLLQLAERGVVIAPRHVHETWVSEAKKWSFNAPAVSTYESAYKLTGYEPDVVILDEVHKCKDSDAKRHQECEELCRKAEVVVGFTASLMGGRGPLDLRSLRVIETGSVPASETAWRFLFGLDTKLEEVAPGRKAYVTKTWDTDKIAGFVKPYVHSIDTTDLLNQLPPVTEQIVKLERPKDYGLVMTGGATQRTKSKRTAQLRQCTDGFVEMDDNSVVELNNVKIGWIAEFVEHLGEPVVIYAAWRHSIKMLTKALAEHNPAVIEGEGADNGYQVGRFKRGETNVLIANAAFSEGMNLQERCRTMIFMSLSSNPVNLQQAIGRIHRPGQTRGCQVLFLQCENTIDERAFELVRAHEELSEEQIEKLLEDCE